MFKKIKLISIIATALVILTPYSAQAHNCGRVMGKEIKTYGNLTCAKAKAVYKAFNKGNIPKGWTCGQSVGGCGKGNSGFTFNPDR